MIVANNVKQEGAGFGVDTNAVTIFKRDGSVLESPLTSKREISQIILKEVITLLEGRET
jgi:phosphopantothenoylcysteine decarboxylase/phosphopantothenate--cysteine ligase